MIDPQTAAILRELAQIIQWTLVQIQTLGHATIPVSTVNAYLRDLDRIRDSLSGLTTMHVHAPAKTTWTNGSDLFREVCSCGFVREAFGEWHKET